MSKKIIVALGGNAILSDDPSAKGQQEALRKTSQALVKLIEAGYRLTISHGNGPQVGNLLLQQAIADSETNPAMPLDTAVAMTQGSIGYWLEIALREELAKKSINKEIATLLTQVEVDAEDDAFINPTKPIGPFLSQDEAEKATEATGDIYKEDAGRGYRKVVPSPKPSSILASKTIKNLVENDVIVIAGGGGGIPVIHKDGSCQGVEAVIDKDFASAKLAALIDADELVILTGVDNIYINYNQPNQEALGQVTVSELEEYIEQGQFAAGSMLPKVQAAISFIKEKPESKVHITSLENIDALLGDGSSTVIING